MQVQCKIRGIFSTALSLLFARSKDYEITFPSALIMERLHLSPSFKPIDVSINDRWDHMGINLEAREDVITRDEFPLSHDKIPGCAIVEGYPHKFSIYNGVVTKKNERKGITNVLLDEGENLNGVLPEMGLKIGSNVIVQVQEPGIGKRKARLKTDITLPGSYTVLLHGKKNKTLFSKKISDIGLKSELKEIGEQYLTNQDNFGIIFRSACKESFIDDIKADLEKLGNIMSEVQERIEACDEGLVIDPLGLTHLNILFSKDSLDYLDTTRRDVISTVKNHHALRILAQKTKDGEALIDFIEYLTANMRDQEENLARIFNNFIHENVGFPEKYSMVQFLHYKPDGAMYKLKPGKVIDVFYSKDDILAGNESCASLLLKREFNPTPWHRSFYDGFEGLDIQPGDYSECHVKENFPVIHNKYFRKNGDFIGSYYNISTPVQIYPGEIIYLDLEIDVVEDALGEKKIIDQERLDDVVNKGYISKKMKDFARDVAKKLIEGKIQENLACDDSFI
ncbi:MAG: ribonuclease E/G [Candidatus Hodarchaeota archaeon]